METYNKFLDEPFLSVDIVRRIKDENKYLRTEIKEEKEKLENTIKALHKELKEIKEDHRKLINEIHNYQKIKKMYNLI